MDRRGTAGSTAEGKAHRAAGDLCKGLARHGRRVVPVGGKGARHGGGHEARRGYLEAIYRHRGAEDPEILDFRSGRGWKDWRMRSGFASTRISMRTRSSGRTGRSSTGRSPAGCSTPASRRACRFIRAGRWGSWSTAALPGRSIRASAASASRATRRSRTGPATARGGSHWRRTTAGYEFGGGNSLCMQNAFIPFMNR